MTQWSLYWTVNPKWEHFKIAIVLRCIDTGFQWPVFSSSVPQNENMSHRLTGRSRNNFYSHHFQYFSWKVFFLLYSYFCSYWPTLYFIGGKTQVLSQSYCEVVFDNPSSAATHLTDFRGIRLTIPSTSFTFCGIITDLLHLTFQTKLSSPLQVCSNLLYKCWITFFFGHFLAFSYC